MTMDKHSNTWFPGDSVRRKADGTKIAGLPGTIDDVDAGLEIARVKHEDGSSDWIKLEDLERV